MSLYPTATHLYLSRPLLPPPLMGTACLVSCSVVTNSLFTTKHVFVPKLVCEIYYNMKVPPWSSLSFLRSLTFSEASARSGPEEQKGGRSEAFRILKVHASVLGKILETEQPVSL